MKKLIVPRAEHCISRSLLSPNGLKVLYKLKEHGFTAYLVGGGVRDLLLGREPKDFDVVTDATPGQLKKIFRNCRLIGRRFRLAHLHFQDEIIEVATFRSTAAAEETGEEQPESAQAAGDQTVLTADGPEAGAGQAAEPGGSPASADEPATAEPGLPAAHFAHSSGQEAQPPESAVEPEPGAFTEVAPRERGRRGRDHHHHGPQHLKSEDGMVLRDNVFGTPEEDAIRRDFTVNALFYNVADFSIIDHVGGMEDLKAGVIRTIGDPLVRFTEDPVRMIRAVRFAAMLGFNIEERTAQAMTSLAPTINKATPPRLYEEVLKLLMMGAGERTYQMMRSFGLFEPLFPHFDAWLGSESDCFPHVRVGKALDWFDERIQAGLPVSAPLLVALMFGEYLEEKMAGFRESGLSPQQATDAAVAEFAGELAATVSVPNRVLLAVREILSCQLRFQKTPGRNGRGVVGRNIFPDALSYLRFVEFLNPGKRSLADWWERFAAQQTLPPADTAEAAEAMLPAEGEAPAKAKRKRRRRRRRKPSGQPESPL